MTLRRYKALLLPLCTACLLLAGWMVHHSLSGGQLAGCGAGSGCGSVMRSRWAWMLGGVPVSLPAAVLYLLLIICLLFYGHSGLDPESQSLNPLIRRLMLLLAGCIAGAALWFTWLQIGVLHAFCPYCTVLHGLGCVVAGVILFTGESRVKPGMTEAGPGMTGKGFWFAAGLAAAAVFAFVQVHTLPDGVYAHGHADASLPTFEAGEIPVLEASGLSDSPASHSGSDPESLSLLFDFQCIHCRRLHRSLPELLERAGGRYRILLCPVPLSSACNPYLPASGIDRFAGSCPLTRLALAVWYARPDACEAYWGYLLGDGDEHARISPDEAENRARDLLGDELGAALADPRIDRYLQKAEELFGRTSSPEKSGVPRFIHDQRWLVAETNDADELLTLLREQL